MTDAQDEVQWDAFMYERTTYGATLAVVLKTGTDFMDILHAAQKAGEGHEALVGANYFDESSNCLYANIEGECAIDRDRTLEAVHAALVDHPQVQEIRPCE